MTDVESQARPSEWLRNQIDEAMAEIAGWPEGKRPRQLNWYPSTTLLRAIDILEKRIEAIKSELEGRATI